MFGKSLDTSRGERVSINTFLRNLAVRLEKKTDGLFSYDVNSQRKYIEKLGAPTDEIARSFFQYKCQMKMNKIGTKFLMSIASFPMALLYLFKHSTTVVNIEKKDAVFFRDGKPSNILPSSLKKEYSAIEDDSIDGFILTKEDRKYIRMLIKRYPLSWHFVLKCMIKIGKYRFAIEKHSPNAIIVCAEYSFTSSVLTNYCRTLGVKHINVMHGEKLYYMRDSFFKFDKCYVWDSYYVELLSSMQADRKQFVVEIPDSLKFCDEPDKEDKYDYTYYLAAENDEILEKISQSLKLLSNRGKRIAVRPHPRYSNMESVKKFFAFIDIEDGSTVSIEKSLLQTGAAISLYSTVLNQAFCNSIPVVIDDVSNRAKFNKLKELEYILLNKEHRLLSDEIGETV